MSTALTCQDLSFVGGQRFDCPYPAPTSVDSVDVSTETLASFWAAGPLDDTSCQHEPPQQETHSHLDYGTSSEPIWNDHLSPHLQRNKQLQDTLIQREEELARLHEENNKLKEFLNSSLVKTLEEKTKRLLSAQSGDGRRNRKRNLQSDGGFSNLSASQLLLGTQVKRTCRNLSLEFCSEEELATTLPVDCWILQTLGLKDEDTIDTSTECSLTSSFYSVTKCSPNTNSSDDYCQTTRHEASNYSSPVIATGHGASIELSTNYSPTFNTTNNYNVSTDACSNFTADAPSVQYSPNIVATPNYQVTHFELPLDELVNTLSSPDTIQQFNHISASSSNLSHDRGPELHNIHSRHCRSSTCPPVDNVSQYTTPSTPCSRTEVAFSMSLSPSSTVRTHSFPQGQAFVCKETQGGWNFTWVPKQCLKTVPCSCQKAMDNCNRVDDCCIAAEKHC